MLSSGGSPSKSPPPAKLPPVIATFANRSSGIFGLLPTGWSAGRGPGLVRLASRDGTSVVLIAALPSQAAPSALLASAVHSLRQTYKNPTTKLSAGSTLNGLPVRSRVLYGANRRGVPIRILVIAAQRRRFGYIIEAFNSRKAPLKDLEESQEIVSSLRLTG